MAKNKKEEIEIDENALLLSIYERDNHQPAGITQPTMQEKPVDTSTGAATAQSEPEMPATTEPQKEEIRTKRGGGQEYETLFIRETDLPPARFGKSVYIRKEYHDRISQIISVIGVNEVSLFGYIDNVLAHHFENFRDDITRSFKKKTIFK